MKTDTLWHPCSQMMDYQAFPAIEVDSAQGSYLHCKNGHKLIDAISSWWCKPLGHQHPALKQALQRQMDRFEHVILANTTNTTIENLSSKLTTIDTPLSRVFYAGDGSSAVEIALKMSLHSRKILGQSQRTKFMSLQNSYHGETSGAMSISDLGIYKSAYRDILFESITIGNIPYVNSTTDPLWHDCFSIWPILEQQIAPYREQITAIIVEPIVQGVNGMKLYSADFLRRLYSWAKENDIHVIADEIMTGFGRTGKTFAYQHAKISPDFVCVGKALTGGWMAMSAVLLTNEIYDLFYNDYQTGHNFLHSNTYSGNALAASVALATINIIEQQNLTDRANKIGEHMKEKMHDIAMTTKALKNIRQIGAIVAADLITDQQNDRMGYHIYQHAIKLGALLRPLGNTIYWLPPLTTELSVLDKLSDITTQAITTIYS